MFTLCTVLSVAFSSLSTLHTKRARFHGKGKVEKYNFEEVSLKLLEMNDPNF